ncbi:MAG: HlyC/CorC family transporter [Lachnospiraceae bacterium]|nr:HlyC/CorC family transporter [Lachnospiraceae bacterium]
MGIKDWFKDNVTEEEIISMVNEGHEQGVLKASEAVMIRNIFAFGDKDAKDIMTHRGEIAAINGDTALIDTINIFNENHYSRYPVYIDDLDNIIGIVHIKELLAFAMRPEDYDKPIKELQGLMLDPEFVPETHSISTLFTQMQLEKDHMVLVNDEYGQISGLITMEDILEEIVGNIEDEHDEEKDSITRDSAVSFRMEGLTPLDEVGSALGIEFSESEFETLNGYLVDQIGHVPKEGETFSIEAFGYRFDVKSVSDRMIEEVVVTKI